MVDGNRGPFSPLAGENKSEGEKPWLTLFFPWVNMAIRERMSPGGLRGLQIRLLGTLTVSRVGSTPIRSRQLMYTVDHEMITAVYECLKALSARVCTHKLTTFSVTYLYWGVGQSRQAIIQNVSILASNS